MTRFGRAACALLLLVLTVSCTDDARDDDPCGGGGCLSWGGGSPHPYTSSSGGTTTTLTGEIRLDYEGTSSSIACMSSACTWQGAVISLEASLPNDWFVPDAGDAGDAGDDRDAGDAGADDGDASVIGSPRGWGTLGQVAIVDLGSTRLEGSGALTGATLVTCESRYERLSFSDGEYLCTSGGDRPARVEPITGTITSSTRALGETTTTTRTVHAFTASGAAIDLSLRSETSPYRTTTAIDCY